jgi:hypothetical protein
MDDDSPVYPNPGDLIVLEYAEHGIIDILPSVHDNSDRAIAWDRNWDDILDGPIAVDLNHGEEVAILIAREPRERMVTIYLVTPKLVGWAYFDVLPWAVERL